MNTLRQCIQRRVMKLHFHSNECRFLRGISGMVERQQPIFLRARQFLSKTAIIDQHGTHSYERLLRLSRVLGDRLVSAFGERDLAGARTAFLCPNDVSYVAAQWAIWRNGGIAVPLCPAHPASLIEYVLQDCQAQMVIAFEDMVDQVQFVSHQAKCVILSKDVIRDTSELGAKALHLTTAEETMEWDECGAMILYTSGTTGRPKGVLTTHSNLRAQITSMVTAWGWHGDDCILHVLPLHHIHGIVNVLACPLWVGATCYMLPKFQPDKVWELLTGTEPQLSLFMAVPTIYAKLIQYHEQQNISASDKARIKQRCQALRLMVSGSAALPQPIMEQWREISGHTLLERYGMTEIGMALTNPLHGPRLPGSVGNPMPGTDVRIMAGDKVLLEGNESGTKITPGCQDIVGELQVRGPAVFTRYWNKDEATRDAFTDGWFKTGDTTAYVDGSYRILGRTSVDIIKCGGYKISALEIERLLLAHEEIVDCTVVGVPDPVWGERVAAIVEFKEGKEMTLNEFREWASSQMAPYQIPTLLRSVKQIPRNLMGKVNKKEILETFN